MASGNTYYLLQPWDTIRIADSENPHHWLGRITRNFDKPESEFTPPDPSSAHGEISEDDGLRNVHALVKSSKDPSVFSELTKILRLSTDNRRGENASFTSPQIQRFRLRNEREVFEKLVKEADVLGKLQDWCKNRNSAYMIVGFLATTRLAFSNGAAKEGTTEQKFKMDLVGLRIFAIEYRTLRRKLFTNSGRIDIKGYGPRSDITFGDEKEIPDGKKESSWQYRMVMDDSPLSELEEAEERCFTT